jgi:putative endonuclease
MVAAATGPSRASKVPARRFRLSRKRAISAQCSPGRESSPLWRSHLGVASVYLLRCADGSLYCGWTTDIQRRVAAHRSGTASRYTRSRRPVELAAVIPVADRSAALREEARIKRLPRAAKLQLIEATGTPR